MAPWRSGTKQKTVEQKPVTATLFEDTKRKPLNPKTTRLNDAIQTQYIDVDKEDTSPFANCSRSISKVVGSVFTPRQVLGLLRVLKAITLAFIVLTILANCMYVIFVEIMPHRSIREQAGGTRDIILRVYAFALSILGVLIELDFDSVVERVLFLKAFVPRALLYFLIANITASPPRIFDESGQYSSKTYSDDDQSFSSLNSVQLPTSAIGFQRVSSFVLACCALGYAFCGLLCLDRFTARAFLSTKDPLVTTAIPAAGALSMTSLKGANDSDSDRV